MTGLAIIIFILGLVGSIIFGIKKKYVWMTLCIIVSVFSVFILLATWILLTAID